MSFVPLNATLPRQSYLKFKEFTSLKNIVVRINFFVVCLAPPDLRVGRVGTSAFMSNGLVSPQYSKWKHNNSHFKT